jgi:kumamolisin
MSSYTSKDRVVVIGSERRPLPGARRVGDTPGHESMEVILFLHRVDSSQVGAHFQEMGKKIPRERQYISHKEFEAKHGSSPEALAKVEAFASQHGLKIVEKSIARRIVKLSGTVSAFNSAFGVNLAEYQHPGGTYRGREGGITIPANLADAVLSVHGLDNRRQLEPRIKLATEKGKAKPRASGGYDISDLKTLYNFPTNDGTGQCIGILEFGGGYTPADLSTFFSGQSINQPNVSDVLVGGGTNKPGVDPNSDGEVEMDVEIAGGVAPGAKMVVYFATNDDAGFIDALTQAVHDTQNNPSVISISWGNPESLWTQATMHSIDQALQDAASLGITVCVAAGDHGSGDGQNDGNLHADFPASSPSALGCGGTTLNASGGTITSEVVWNNNDGWATGGGVSDPSATPPGFPVPSYQRSVQATCSTTGSGLSGRGVPDVAGDADANTGYNIIVDGAPQVGGGTSAVAPLWAGLIALVNQSIGTKVGYINTLIYSSGGKGFNDITSGNNDTVGKGCYQTSPGWDACTGWGSPSGGALLGVLNPGGSGRGGR